MINDSGEYLDLCSERKTFQFQGSKAVVGTSNGRATDNKDRVPHVATATHLGLKYIRYCFLIESKILFYNVLCKAQFFVWFISRNYYPNSGLSKTLWTVVEFTIQEFPPPSKKHFDN